MRRAVGDRLSRLWYPAAGGETSPPPALLRAAARAYALAMRARAGAYAGGLFTRGRLPVPCVAVGNLTVGGTGKTPLTAWLVEQLAALGARPGVISRGYGGTERGPALVPGGAAADPARYGDEPVLLAARFPTLPVVVGRDRRAAGLLAATAAGATVVVADDAFQHLALARDLDVVAVDAARGLGNGRLLPAGPLREPPSALGRADVVVLTRVAEAGDPAPLRRAVAALAPRAAVAEADLVADGWREARGGPPVELPAGAGVYAFSGIANPEAFRRSLAGRGVRLLGWEAFPDHHPYRPAELVRLGRAAADSGAVAVTTAKDAVRIGRWPGPGPLYRAEVKLVMISGREQLWETLKSLAAGGRA